jgi:GH25 family lysozyme M1 (1,4-beta-N-acetylmuramidase)
MAIRGIDVSSYQSSTYALDGVDFVIVKATEGTSYRNPKHSAQIARAREHNRVVGHYHYLSSGSGIASQITYFLDHIDARRGELLALDWEDPGVTSDDKDEAINRLKEQASGHRILLYCNVDFWKNRNTSPKRGDGLWIAHYNGKPGEPGITSEWLLHQYTSDPVDTSVAAFGSRAEMAEWAVGTA